MNITLNENIEKIIVKYKILFLSIPVIILFALYIVYDLKSDVKNNVSLSKNSYNTSIPIEDKKMKVNDPNNIYNKAREDSLRNEKIGYSKIKEIGGVKKLKKDSLNKALEELENFSFNDKNKIKSNVVPEKNDRHENRKIEKKEDIDEIDLEKERERILKYYEEKNKLFGIKKKDNKEQKSFVAAFFKDQRLIPGDILKLFLVKDLKYDGKLFPRGTFLYAVISISENRVFFDINNISHVPLKLKVYDAKDGRLGMPSQRARKLWNMYKEENVENTTDEISTAVESSSNNRMFSKSVTTMANFFKRKNLRKKDHLFFLNDHQVLIKINK